MWGCDSTPEIPLLNFYLPHMYVGPDCFAPPTSLIGSGFFNSVVVRLPSIQLDFLPVLSDGCSIL